jgi:hypothetical protein
MQVKQWQERRTENQTADGSNGSSATATASSSGSPEAEDQGGVDRREGGWVDEMIGKVPEVRVVNPCDILCDGRRRGDDGQQLPEVGSEMGDSGVDIDEEWDDLCSATESEQDEDEELTDIEM